MRHMKNKTSSWGQFFSDTFRTIRPLLQLASTLPFSLLIFRREAANMPTPVEVQSARQYADTALETQFALIWNMAIEDFNGTSNTDAASIWLPELKNCSISQLCDRIENQNKQYKGFVRRTKKIVDCLKDFLRPVRAFSNIAGSGVSIVSYWFATVGLNFQAQLIPKSHGRLNIRAGFWALLTAKRSGISTSSSYIRCCGLYH
jgi:hypothetical protein